MRIPRASDGRIIAPPVILARDARGRILKVASPVPAPAFTPEPLADFFDGWVRPALGYWIAAAALFALAIGLALPPAH